MADRIQVLLVDDHAVVRAGFKLLLSTSANIAVIAEATRGEQALQLYSQLQPDIVVMDLSMPGIGGLETIRRLCQRNAQARILVFSVHDQQVFVQRALQAGARGYISKNTAPHILTEAIESLFKGKIYVESGLSGDSMLQQGECDYRQLVDNLSAREFDVFRLLAMGLTSHGIAEELCLGYKTVANYATRIKKKLRASSVAELTRIAMSLGIQQR